MTLNMKEKWNFVLYLVWFSFLFLSAVFMFGHGFLLSRKTLDDVTECIPLHLFGCNGRVRKNSSLEQECTEHEKIRRILAIPGGPLACTPIQSRVILLIVDAFRYDFAEYDASIMNPLPYQNRLPILWELLDRAPGNTRMYRFIADPPTTTLQRVKALATGSLPTFIDASSNFAAMELQEDNIIDQLLKNKGQAVLLGDDTWRRLMPGKYLRSHTMYSFHTWDLDTEDNELDSRIYDELKKDDWDLLVAHYLGVDHAGHRYGPNHPEMTRKLDEMNCRLKKVVDMIPPDVLLYIVGDHGMTETGDHGGESKAESISVFFVYRGAGLSGNGADEKIGKEVHQTDLAPTLCAALGRPPPAPSLGILQLPALPKLPIIYTLLTISNNLKQITKYLVRYGEESQQVPLDKLTELINLTREQLNKAAAVATNEDLKKYIADVRALVKNVRGVFREVWVEFDTISMVRALLLMFSAILFNWLITEGIPIEQLPHLFASAFVPNGIISVAVCILACCIAYYFNLLLDLENAIIHTTSLVSGAMMCLVVIMHWDGIVQRWQEVQPQLFYERFARFALIASAAVLLSNSYIIEEGAVLSHIILIVLGLMSLNISTIKALILWIANGVVLVVSRVYRGCREEQGDCWTAGLGVPTGKVSQGALMLALGSVAVVVALVRHRIGWRGYGVVLAGLLVGAHWVVAWMSQGCMSRSRLLAKVSWLLLGLMFLMLWRRDSQGPVLPLVVCGLLVYMGNNLVLGAAYAPAAALGLLSGFLALNVVSILKSDGTKCSLSTSCSTSVACLWALLASYNFYGTGHHATLGHIRWAPAFHAEDPNYLVVTTFLVSYELFGMLAMYGATVPLLALWGHSNALAGGGRLQLTTVYLFCLKFAHCFAIRVFMCALAATIHCRHLMIWGVFTPKLLFESSACAAALAGTIIGAALMTWHLPTQHRST